MPRKEDLTPNLFGDPTAGMRKAEPRAHRSRVETLEDYEGFVEKFKAKKTTDDCYTPAWAYEIVRRWVDRNITPLEGRRIVRPFYPGGDFEAFPYEEGDIVLDNPPFSILAKIRRYYQARGIDYFLFAPALTLFGAPAGDDETFVVADANITYENGATVRTSFVTNCAGEDIRVMLRGDFGRMLTEESKRRAKADKMTLKKHVLPMEVITAATLGRLVTRGICFDVPRSECQFTRALDSQRVTGDSLFGGGFLLSERMTAVRIKAERAAAEIAEAERAAANTWTLSERERALTKELNPKP